MITTVSTVKDTPANVRRFVEGSLRGGVDHMFIFLDAPDPEVESWLGEHPHVSHLVTGEQWWAGRRPDDLNVRQRANANVVRSVLTRAPSVEWIFHVDADEIVQLDPQVLAGLGSDVQYARLLPREAVSRKRWEEDPVWFKRLLDPDELHLLEVLGVLDKPQNSVYFHGHVEGKVGMRPALDAWLTLHRVVDAQRDPLDTFEHEALRLLHYESYSGEDFVRKWTTMLQGGMPSLRKVRQDTASAVHTLLGMGLEPDALERSLMRVFERTTEDDFETLRDAGVLVQIDPRDGEHVPRAMPAEERETVDAMLLALVGRGKEPFRVCGPAKDVEAVLSQIGPEAPKRRRFLRR